jgi:G3E family GTPase
MTGARGKDTELISVSIVAGPAVTAFLNEIGAIQTERRTGLLTSTKRNARLKGLTVFPQPPGSDPDRIVNDIRGIAEKREIDHLIVECEPDRPPMAYASLFLPGDNSPSSLTQVSRLTATAFAIKPASLLPALLGRETDSGSVCFIAEQIEFVSDVFLEGASGDNDFELARSIVQTLNPRARVATLTPPAIETWSDDRDRGFDFDAALNGAGWRNLLDGVQSTSSADNKITAFAYRARRPFHPERFWDLLQHQLRGVFRAKGFFWLVTRMDGVGGLNLAGSDLHCALAGEWWATRDERTREAEMPERTRKEWQQPFGDRRQSFAIMALDIDRSTLQAQLDACLLTEAEMAGGEDSWHEFADPFPSWSAHPHVHDHACDHEHGSDEHDCCHH